ncbi:MAG: hypothetical protein RBT76_11975 [candidate division Zixibacteria bacterium]|jgi:hypothetical protein|nr:hypothetical protein [candidate division Zixibacteria bacterium]
MKIRAVLGACVIAGVLFSSTAAQTDSGAAPSPCGAPETSQFDFWLGEWHCHSSYTDSLGVDHPYTVRNTITRELGGCVIVENFDGATIGLVGRSLSVYNAELGKWQQTWVDNNGSYMAFEGEFVDGVMTLGRTVDTESGRYVQRMRFTEITDSSFIWFWESSDDNGESWRIQWRLDYERVR